MRLVYEADGSAIPQTVRCMFGRSAAVQASVMSSSLILSVSPGSVEMGRVDVRLLADGVAVSEGVGGSFIYERAPTMTALLPMPSALAITAPTYHGLERLPVAPRSTQYSVSR